MFFWYKSKKIRSKLKNAFALNENERRKAVTNPFLFTARDWRHVLLETRISLRDKNISLLSAGSAFYAGLAFFPLIAASIAIVAYTVDVEDLNTALRAIETYFPIDVAALIGSQIQTAYEYNLRNVGVAIGALVIALYSATRAMSILISAMNVVYEQKENRSAAKVYLLSFVLAVGAILVIAATIALLLVDKSFLLHIHVPGFLIVALPYIRWVLLAAIIASSLAVFYRVARSNDNPYWQWVSWGAGIASIIWLGGTTLFFLYARYLSVYSSIYNIFGSVIVLLVWLNLSAFVILLGAAINHRLEQRTTRRTSLQ
jgi:membrane protein